MGTNTVDEAAAENGAAAKAEEERTGPTTDVTKSDEAAATTPGVTAPATDEAAESDEIADADDEAFGVDEFGAHAHEQDGSTGVAMGAAAVVSAALGFVSLSGSWIGTVAAARQQLVGQLQTSSSASVATQVKSIYGDSWQTSALWGGAFALIALIVGVVVLVRPAFGVPGKPQAVWIKSVSWAGVVLGVIGLLLAVLKYTDVLLGLPSTS
ncbi:hypothetical protein ACIQU5_02460 [Streptomyces sp. NPDC090306]|uniref:hypothetical protein n=1 Tax=Streptomyces sp. NPDC090306 TaxID=3365961 RepID=UPI0038179DBA